MRKLLAALALFFVSAASYALSINGSLGTTPYATDVFNVYCNGVRNGDNYVRIQVRDNAPVAVPQVTAAIGYDFYVDVSGAWYLTSAPWNTPVVDSTDGDLVFSPSAEQGLSFVRSGSMVYWKKNPRVRVAKSAHTGAENYTLYVECFSLGGSRLPTSVVMVQNM